MKTATKTFSEEPIINYRKTSNTIKDAKPQKQGTFETKRPTDQETKNPLPLKTSGALAVFNFTWDGVVTHTLFQVSTLTEPFTQLKLESVFGTCEKGTGKLGVLFCICLSFVWSIC